MITNQKVNEQAMPTTQGTSVFSSFQNAEIKRPDLVKGGVGDVGGDEVEGGIQVVWI